MSHSMGVSPKIIETWIEAGGRNLRVCVGELVDNSADAGATQITIEIDRDVLSVDDNGRGFDGTVEEAIEKFLTYGGSIGGRGRLGRYGIGLKESAAWLAERLDILSSANGRDGVHLAADWNRMLSQKTFTLDASEKKPFRNIGTAIVLSGMRRGRLSAKKKGELKTDLQRTYAPGLREGLIALHFRDGPGNAEQLVAAPRPSLSIHRSFAGFFENREFRVFCGLLLDRKDYHDHSGWHFCYGPRVIKSISSRLTGFYGEVILVEKEGQDWHLDRNKTDFDERELLTDHLSQFSEVQELTRVLNSASRTIELTQVEARVNADIQELFAGLQQQKRPGRPGKSSGHEPKGNERILKDAATVDANRPGNVKRRKSPKDPKDHLGHLQPHVRWVDWGPEAPIGKCELEPSKAEIEVNQSHPWFTDNREDTAMMAIAVTLFAEAYSRWEGPQLTMRLNTPDQNQRIVTLLSSLLASVKKQYAGVSKAA